MPEVTNKKFGLFCCGHVSALVEIPKWAEMLNVLSVADQCFHEINISVCYASFKSCWAFVFIIKSFIIHKVCLHSFMCLVVFYIYIENFFTHRNSQLCCISKIVVVSISQLPTVVLQNAFDHQLVKNIHNIIYI